ncbi:long-chain fatty acid--CoA ligase [Endozoicomonas numazuensis]|uniref:Long-chain-fatty-acid--CoA ligase n=1 Tax=Endozoicomonas numazuensis TaxID=1137799 RepID=A0A081NFY9_9GAMM|nr:long-chain fatty acid--CoA ligase [Endozoicomonas numazuensis]
MRSDFWKDKYPEGVPSEIDTGQYRSILDVLDYSARRYADKPVFSNLGKSITYSELHELSGHFCSYLQNETDLRPGDRIAIMLPNLLQFPIAVYGALRAGLVVVNTNPLYTEREMEHQFCDSGAKALVVLANMAHMAEKVVSKTSIETVVITEVGDMLPPLKKTVVNLAVKYVKKMVPDYHVKGSVRFSKAMKLGTRHTPHDARKEEDEVAVLQYTGGTTGVAKGAMLTHRNILSNMFQVKAMVARNLEDGKELLIAPLPLYHIFAFTVHCMVGMLVGAHNMLITNPRDMKTFMKDIKGQPFSMFVGLNTLFVGLMNNPEFRKMDFSHLKNTVSGGMALQMDTAERWENLTGCKICEGYGMTETSPVVTINPLDRIKLGSIGIPVPSCELKVIDDDGNDLGLNAVGELCVKGPQVMKGYWDNVDATDETIDEKGWLKTGDIARIDDEGYVTIVDRKKDMICISGFNVYPNELEEVMAMHPDVDQCAAIGVPHEKTGEAIKMFLVSSNPTMNEEHVTKHLRKHVTGYKVPKQIEFRDELPTTNVGKILRRELRDEELKKRGL